MLNAIMIGTTPTHTFTLPFDTSEIKTVVISYGQNDIEIFFKEAKDCTTTGNEIAVQLTQEDTFKLQFGNTAQIQINVLKVDGGRFNSDIIPVDVDGRVLHKEVLV